jgi:hypothetical protein
VACKANKRQADSKQTTFISNPSQISQMWVSAKAPPPTPTWWRVKRTKSKKTASTGKQEPKARTRELNSIRPFPFIVLFKDHIKFANFVAGQDSKQMRAGAKRSQNKSKFHPVHPLRSFI